MAEPCPFFIRNKCKHIFLCFCLMRKDQHGQISNNKNSSYLQYTSNYLWMWQIQPWCHIGDKIIENVQNCWNYQYHNQFNYEATTVIFHYDTISYLLRALLGQQTRTVVEIKQVSIHKGIRMINLITARLVIDHETKENRSKVQE